MKQKKIIKKNRHKVTLAAYRAIERLASDLPEMVHTDKASGAAIVQTFTEVVLGDKIPKEDRYKIRDWDPNKRYTILRKRHALVNHVIVMKDIYEHDGDKGIEDYLNIIQAHLNHEQLLLKNLKDETLWQRFVRFIKE